MTIEPVALAGHREVVVRDEAGRTQRHFVILCFASRWIAGEPVLNDELDESRWIKPSELKDLKITEGLDRGRRLRTHGHAGLKRRLARDVGRGHTSREIHAQTHSHRRRRGASHGSTPCCPSGGRRTCALRRRPATARRNPGRAALPPRHLRRQRRAEMAQRNAGPA